MFIDVACVSTLIGFHYEMRLILRIWCTFPQKSRLIIEISKTEMWFCWSQSNDYNDINIFLSLENSRTFLLAKEKSWKRIFKTNSELLQNHAEKQFVLSTSFFMIYDVITTPQDGFIASHVWEIVGTKNLTIFKDCQYFRFYMMISSNFWSIEKKNLNSNPCISNYLVLGTTSPAAY